MSGHLVAIPVEVSGLASKLGMSRFLLKALPMKLVTFALACSLLTIALLCPPEIAGNLSVGVAGLLLFAHAITADSVAVPTMQLSKRQLQSDIRIVRVRGGVVVFEEKGMLLTSRFYREMTLARAPQ